MTDSEWRLLQADKFAAERQRDEAVQSSQSWRREAKRLEAQVDRLTYELKRWKEVDANKPDWEKLWEEQSEKADALKAQVDRLLAKEAARIVQELSRPPGSEKG
jgi:hypothetical protein